MRVTVGHRSFLKSTAPAPTTRPVAGVTRCFLLSTRPLPGGWSPPRARRAVTHRDHLVLQVCAPRQAEAKASPLLLVQDGDMDAV